MRQRESNVWLPKNLFARFLVVALFVVGTMLMGINLYGLTQSIRKPGLGLDRPEDLRFVPKEVWSYERSIQEIYELHDIRDRTKAARQAIKVVKQALVHPDWFGVDPVEYRQTIPIWENYFLYIVGRFSDLPQFQRYHFVDYRRSIRRGIGVCGDASMVLSSILSELRVKNRILSFDGHVIVEYLGENGNWTLADPDFGVSLNMDIQQLKNNGDSIKMAYKNAGYSDDDINTLMKSYGTPYAVFDSVYDFMSMRFIFEYITYVLKWMLPALLVAPGLWFLYRGKRRATQKRTVV